MVDQLFNGTISFTNLTPLGPTPPGQNLLTVTFTNADLGGLAGGGSASLVGSRPPQGVTFTSAFAAVQALIAGNPPENFSLSFSNLSNALGTTGAGPTIASFTAQSSGTFATGTIPEPSSIVMASMGLVVGLGTYGYRRRQG
jgi:hypothetical protein